MREIRFMKHTLLVFAFVFLNLVVRSQVTMQTNIPAVIAPDADLFFEIKINKGSIANFAKYQIDVPEKVTISEVDSKNGTFSFENNRAKIVWVNVPTESEFVISMKLKSAAATGTASFIQRFYYLEEGTRKDLEAEPVLVTFDESGVKTNQASTASNQPEKPKVEEQKVAEKPKIEKPKAPEPKTPEPKAVEPIKIAKPNTNIENKKAGELIQQALQLKKDAKAASILGQKEKKESEQKLAEANELLTKAESISDETERKVAVDNANDLKTKAENNIAVATKILLLSKSLDDNANEIENLVKKQGAALFANQSKKANSTDKGEIAASMSQKDIGEFRQQALKLRNDAKDAAELGNKEKAAAEKKIAEASDLTTNAENSTNEEEKTTALEKAKALKLKGESDLSNAENILSLSATLESNALDIETLIEKFYSPVEGQEEVAAASTSNNKKSSNNSKSSKSDSYETFKPEQGLIYKVQIGSFEQEPDKSVFRGIGKVTLVNENERIKALIGSYNSKEAALKKRLELIDKGFDAFVVAYKDGIRVK